MKKSFIVSAIAFLCLTMVSTTSLYAQSPVDFGFKGGVTFANFNGQDYSSDARTGIAAGLYLNISLPAAPISLQPEALYIQKGTKASEQGVTGTIKLDYIQVPVLAKIGIPSPGPVTPHLLIGPYIGFNVNAEAEVSGGGGSFSGDISDQVKSTDFGGIAGIGTDINAGPSKLSIQARYSLGLTEVYEDDFNDGEKNGVIEIVAGISF